MAAVLPVQYVIETDRDLEAKLAGKGLKGAAQVHSRDTGPFPLAQMLPLMMLMAS